MSMKELAKTLKNENLVPKEIRPAHLGSMDQFSKKLKTPLVYFHPAISVPRENIKIDNVIKMENDNEVSLVNCTLSEFQNTLTDPIKCVPGVAYYNSTMIPTNNYFNNIYAGLSIMQEYDKSVANNINEENPCTMEEIQDAMRFIGDRILDRRDILTIIFNNRVRFLARNIIITFLSEISDTIMNISNNNDILDSDGKSLGKCNIFYNVDIENLVEIIVNEFGRKIRNTLYSSLDSKGISFGDTQYSIQVVSSHIYDEIDKIICNSYIVNTNPYGQVNHLTIINAIYKDFISLVQNLQLMAMQLRNECDLYYHEAGYAKPGNILEEVGLSLVEKYRNICETDTENNNVIEESETKE